MKHRVFKTAAAMCIIASVVVCAGSARLFGQTYETWMDMYLSGVKAGYVHHVKEEAEFLNRPAVGYKTETYMKMSGFVVVRKSCVMEIDYVDEESSPLGFVKVFKLTGTEDRIVEGTVQEDELRIEIRKGDEVTTKTLKLPDNFLFDEAADEKLRASGYRTGDRIRFFTIGEDGTDFVPVEKTVAGKAGDTVEIRTVVEVKRPFTIKMHVNLSGDVLKMEYADTGMILAKVERSKAEADYPGLDMNAATLEENELLHKPHALRKLKLKVIIDEKDPGSLFLSDERQQPETKGKNCILQVESISPDTLQFAKLPLDDETRARLKPFLEPNDMIQSDDPMIRKEAKETAGAETDMWNLSMLISEKTRTLLSPSYDLAYASALEAVQQGKGDCSEHAVVFAALARSLGIPVRICYGMAYFDFGFFGFHAWNEVYVGRWVPIDAAMAQVRVDATHIALHKGDGGTSDLDYGYINLKLMGRLKFKVMKCSYWKESGD